jgi:hypothetical protein
MNSPSPPSEDALQDQFQQDQTENDPKKKFPSFPTKGSSAIDFQVFGQWVGLRSFDEINGFG